jgi:hypothetical protein
MAAEKKRNRKLNRSMAECRVKALVDLGTRARLQCI